MAFLFTDVPGGFYPGICLRIFHHLSREYDFILFTLITYLWFDHTVLRKDCWRQKLLTRSNRKQYTFRLLWSLNQSSYKKSSKSLFGKQNISLYLIGIQTGGTKFEFHIGKLKSKNRVNLCVVRFLKDNLKACTISLSSSSFTCHYRCTDGRNCDARWPFASLVDYAQQKRQ